MRKKISRMKVSRFFAQVSLDELSHLTGIEKSKLSRIENGWIIPTDRERRRIARALKAKEGELFVKDKADTKPSWASYSPDLAGIQFSAKGK